jgi:hypothetical protein
MAVAVKHVVFIRKVPFSNPGQDTVFYIERFVILFSLRSTPSFSAPFFPALFMTEALRNEYMGGGGNCWRRKILKTRG